MFTVSTDDAVAGSYEINVLSLAKAQINTVDIDISTNSGGSSIFNSDYYGDGTNIGAYSSTSTALFDSNETGTFSVTVGDTSTNISVDATTTLGDLASSINAVDGLSAYVVQIGTEAALGSDGYQLFVQADTAEVSGDRFSLDFDDLDVSRRCFYNDRQRQVRLLWQVKPSLQQPTPLLLMVLPSMLFQQGRQLQL